MKRFFYKQCRGGFAGTDDAGTGLKPAPATPPPPAGDRRRRITNTAGREPQPKPYPKQQPKQQPKQAKPRKGHHAVAQRHINYKNDYITN